MRGLPLHDADWLRERQSLCRAKGLVIMRSAREALIRLCSCQSQPQTRRTGSGLQKWPPLSRFLFFSSAFEECPGSYWTLECTVPSQTIGWNDMGSYRKRACAISGGWGGAEWANPTDAESTPVPPLQLCPVAMATPPLLAGPVVQRPRLGLIRAFGPGTLSA